MMYSEAMEINSHSFGVYGVEAWKKVEDQPIRQSAPAPSYLAFLRYTRLATAGIDPGGTCRDE